MAAGSIILGTSFVPGLATVVFGGAIVVFGGAVLTGLIGLLVVVTGGVGFGAVVVVFLLPFRTGTFFSTGF